jgi:tRNA(Ile)-lysidine synthase
MTNSFSFSSVPKGSRLIVGISGGCDSVALLHLLLESYPNPSRHLIAAHVNYGLRGKQSEADEKYVRELCAQWKVPLRVLKASHFKKNKKSIQDKARELRYSFFQKLARREKAWGAAVAHHLEDQAETILDRFLRGAGTKGLSGLQEVQTLTFSKSEPPLKVWRPLLRETKESLKNYLSIRNITWREDLSNQKLDYRRNQIRHKALPFLTQWNSRLVEILARMGEVTTVEDQFMDQVLNDAGKKLKSRWVKKAYFCDASSFDEMHLALQRRWVKRTAEKLTSDARGLSFDQIEEILQIWAVQKKGPRDVGYGLSAGRKGSSLYLKYLGLKK